MALAKLNTTLRTWLDATSNAMGNPFGVKARDIKLGQRLEELAELLSGVEQIDNGDTTVVIAVGSDYDGMPAVASIGTAGSSALYVKSCEWDGSGNLTVTVDQDPTQDIVIYYTVDGRGAVS